MKQSNYAHYLKALKDGKSIYQRIGSHIHYWSLKDLDPPFISKYMTAEYVGNHLAERERAWGLPTKII